MQHVGTVCDTVGSESKFTILEMCQILTLSRQYVRTPYIRNYYLIKQSEFQLKRKKEKLFIFYYIALFDLQI